MGKKTIEANVKQINELYQFISLSQTSKARRALEMKLAIILVICAVAIAFDFTEKIEKTGIVFTKIGGGRVTYDSFTVLYHFEIGNYLKMTQKVEFI